MTLAVPCASRPDRPVGGNDRMSGELEVAMTERPESSGNVEDHPPGVPRWLKVSGLVVGLVVLLLVVAMLLLGGDHGPGRHG